VGDERVSAVELKEFDALEALDALEPELERADEVGVRVESCWRTAHTSSTNTAV
jgi:hypothetical protein